MRSRAPACKWSSAMGLRPGDQIFLFQIQDENVNADRCRAAEIQPNHHPFCLFSFQCVLCPSPRAMPGNAAPPMCNIWWSSNPVSVALCRNAHLFERCSRLFRSFWGAVWAIVGELPWDYSGASQDPFELLTSCSLAICDVLGSCSGVERSELPGNGHELSIAVGCTPTKPATAISRLRTETLHTNSAIPLRLYHCGNTIPAIPLRQYQSGHTTAAIPLRLYHCGLQQTNRLLTRPPRDKQGTSQFR